MLTFEAARAVVLEHIERLAPVRVGALEALGCVLAADIIADIDVAPFDNSAMDGYALRAADIAGASDEAPVTLRVVEHIAAGSFPALAVGPGEASRIMTGAPVPEGIDTVIMVERSEPGENEGGAGGTVAFRQPAKGGENIRRKGEDVQAGATVLHAGEVVSAAAVGLLAAVGAAEVEVYRRPRVAIAATGDELVDVTVKPGLGQIRNSNSLALAALVSAAGGEPHILPIVHDNEQDTRAALSRAPEFDLMITSGGVSMGDFDVVKKVLAEIGVMEFWKVAMRPGAAQTYGTIGGTPFFGLPGNPLASMVGFEILVRPVIRKMRGFTELVRPRTRAVLAEDVRKKGDRHHFLRGRIEGAEGGDGHVVRLSGGQSSAMLSTMHRANCLISLPAEDHEFLAGTTVECFRLDMEEGTA